MDAQQRRPIDSKHPMWLVHIDVWNSADPQKIIDLIPDDIKPYVPYADCHPDAVGGFASQPKEPTLQVVIPEVWLDKVPEELREALTGVLAQDPRPAYQRDPDRVYGLPFGGLEVKFTVAGDVLTVCGVEQAKEKAPR